jgi:pimeloyl-ACP methyl ester carboxylesterase
MAEPRYEKQLTGLVIIDPYNDYRPPESWARRAYNNLIYFHEVDKGGHFAAREQLDFFSTELRTAFRPLRNA